MDTNTLDANCEHGFKLIFAPSGFKKSEVASAWKINIDVINSEAKKLGITDELLSTDEMRKLRDALVK